MTTTTQAEPATAWEALPLLQAELPTVAFDRENPHFKSKFASLAAIMEAVRPLLGKHGFSWVTTPTILGADSKDPGEVALLYSLRHVSGAVVAEGIYPLPGGANAQALGAAITYARRYALCAVLGLVADDDDDGNAAAEAHAGPQRRTAPRQTGPAQPAAPATPNFEFLGHCPLCADQSLKSKSGKPGQMMRNPETGDEMCSGRYADGKAARHTPTQVEFLERQAAEGPQAAAEGGDIDPSEIPF